MVEHPAGYDFSSPLPLFEGICGETAVAFRENRTLGIRKVIVFEAATPRLTRSRAYASPASLPRPSQGSLPARAGSPLAGRVSHPLDDKRSFMESSQPSNPNRPAGPGRTGFPICSRGLRDPPRDSRGFAFLVAGASSNQQGGKAPVWEVVMLGSLDSGAPIAQRPEKQQPRILDRVIGALSDCSRVQEFDLHPHAEDLSSSG